MKFMSIAGCAAAMLLSASVGAHARECRDKEPVQARGKLLAFTYHPSDGDAYFNGTVDGKMWKTTCDVTDGFLRFGKNQPLPKSAARCAPGSSFTASGHAVGGLRRMMADTLTCK